MLAAALALLAAPAWAACAPAQDDGTAPAATAALTMPPTALADRGMGTGTATAPAAPAAAAPTASIAARTPASGAAATPSPRADLPSGGTATLAPATAAPATIAPPAVAGGAYAGGVMTVDPEAAEAARRKYESLLRASWATDFTRASIAYDEIMTGGPPKDGIPSIDHPQFETVAGADAWLDDREPVQVVNINEDVRAYPVQVMVWHELVNDTVGGEPVVITF